jgi:ComF family protein
MKEILVNAMHIIFPATCIGCGEVLQKTEKTICLKCISKLPKTNFHLLDNNPVKDIFVGRFPIVRASSFLYFRKHGIIQRLIHQLKYNGAEKVGIMLGELFGDDLKDSLFVRDIDFIVPVPLHPRKQVVRGYNQAALIGEGMQNRLDIPMIENNLTRAVFTSSQTHKSMYERWENVSNVFHLSDPAQFDGKHILLIDDVITTGSTLEACMHSIANVSDAKISVAVLAKPI